jgi:hypothetical protein
VNYTVPQAGFSVALPSNWEVVDLKTGKNLAPNSAPLPPGTQGMETSMKAQASLYKSEDSEGLMAMGAAPGYPMAMAIISRQSIEHADNIDDRLEEFKRELGGNPMANGPVQLKTYDFPVGKIGRASVTMVQGESAMQEKRYVTFDGESEFTAMFMFAGAAGAESFPTKDVMDTFRVIRKP